MTNRKGNVGGDDGLETSGELVERAISLYEGELVGYANTFVRNVDSARDIVQDTFIRLYQQDVSKVQENLKAWLFTVCRNRALDILRKEKRMVVVDDEILAAEDSGLLTPDQIISDEERLELIKSYINQLPKNQATVILLKFDQGCSYHEIADKTGLASGNIGFLIHTGMKRLREILPNEFR